MPAGLKRTICTALLAFVASIPLAWAQDPEQAEPPLLYQLKVGDKTLPIAEGVPATVEGSFTNPPVTLTVEPYRVFPHGGIAFHYPRHFTFEADLTSPDMKIWTLSGNSFKIMYFVTPQPLTVDAFLASVAQQAGPDHLALDPEPAAIELAGQSFAGKRLNLTLAGQMISTETFALPPRDGNTRLLVLQDSPPAPGTPSEEAKSASGLLTQSFILAP